MSRHFVNRILSLLKKYNASNKIMIRSEVAKDLELWLGFLDKAHSGVSMNLVIEWSSNLFCIADSCDHGIGVFFVKTGHAFRFEIPSNLRPRVSNILEHLAEIVDTWLGGIEGEIQKVSCIFDGTGNISGFGRACKTNFSKNQAPCTLLARKLASLVHGLSVLLGSIERGG